MPSVPQFFLNIIKNNLTSKESEVCNNLLNFSKINDQETRLLKKRIPISKQANEQLTLQYPESWEEDSDFSQRQKLDRCNICYCKL